MLEINGLSVAFDKQVIFENVNIKLHAGDRVALLGPSGIGKSTLLRILAGIQLPDTGNVLFDNVAITYNPHVIQLRCHERVGLAKITLVFQDLQLFPNLTAFQNCVVGQENK
jgi:ABC-type Fe3+/spermidine/putrescine transport system ATPase subunit